MPRRKEYSETTGIDLEVMRVRAGLQVKHIADAMGITPSRVSRIEVDEPVTKDIEARYLRALETCRTSGTSQAA